ncbi:SRPBCC family protein [Sphingomicrobium sediminis]|uniref:SRPBCC domain-containing protein n=1 Tax=Sphingomicrobium sediminis TaxID=2950949 RepID=A0A9X2J1N9_9SPHN|nr:SRPBCC domain-containing protein [Sphingomicrobium sediminis]MCM8557468.1 SRPBCC domain-containing protein [Sphingomicrobium sediminis]
MRFLTMIAAAGIALAASVTPAKADVVSVGTNSFHIRHTVPLVVPAERAYTLLTEPRRWWNGEHSYSLNADNFSLDLRPGGCFCERWDGNFVEHMRVVAVTPGESIILEGGLGPLRAAGASGVLVWSLENTGTGSQLVMDFKVTGFVANDAEQWSAAVDYVIGEQAMRFRERAAQLPRR